MEIRVNRRWGRRIQKDWINHRRRLWRQPERAPRKVEKRPCFHQFLPSFAPQIWTCPQYFWQVNASEINLRMDEWIGSGICMQKNHYGDDEEETTRRKIRKEESAEEKERKTKQWKRSSRKKNEEISLSLSLSASLSLCLSLSLCACLCLCLCLSLSETERETHWEREIHVCHCFSHCLSFFILVEH